MPQLIEVPGYGEVEFPDDMTDDQIAKAIQANMDVPAPQQAAPQQAAAPQPAAKKPYSITEHLSKTAGALKRELSDLASFEGNVLAGVVRGAGSIGSTILAPFDKAQDIIQGNRFQQNTMRRRGIDEGLREIGATPESFPYQAGKIGGEIAGTAGVGSVLAKGAQAANAAPRVVNALRSGGFALGPGGNALSNAALRAGAGGAVGGLSAGLVDPKSAKTGAGIGAIMPGAVQLSGKAGAALMPKVKPEVADLYNKAQGYGIDVPLDRMVDSKPLNAAAASLNYVPFSGRMATEDKMLSQLNRAVSRSFGQDSDNVTMALRKAGTELGKRFDDTLRSTAVGIDRQLLDDLANVDQLVGRELSPKDATIIKNQIDDILEKGASGKIEGQAAYNIKKTLDRISRRSSNESHYAQELRNKLMDAMNRSMPKAEAEAFSKLREQYGNMIRMRKFAQNGAEGGVSVARIANMQKINSPQLQDLADISAQFLRSREAPHGAAQRVGLGLLGGGALGGSAMTGLLPVAAGGMTAGRALNSVLNSSAVKGAALNNGMLSQEALEFIARNPALRTLPVITSTNP